MIGNIRPARGPRPHPIRRAAAPCPPPYDWALERRTPQVLIDRTVVRYTLAVLANIHSNHPQAHTEAVDALDRAVREG